MATISMTLPVYRPLELDVQKPEYQILQQVYGRQGETALTIRATITDDGQPYDFSGKKIEFCCIKPSGEMVHVTEGISLVSGSTYECTLPPEATSEYGTISVAYFRIVKDDDQEYIDSTVGFVIVLSKSATFEAKVGPYSDRVNALIAALEDIIAAGNKQSDEEQKQFEAMLEQIKSDLSDAVDEVKTSSQQKFETNEQTRIEEFNTAQSQRQYTFEASEQSRTQTFNAAEQKREENETARKNAESARVEAEEARESASKTAVENAEEATSNANDAAAKALEAKTNTEKATEAANTATEEAKAATESVKSTESDIENKEAERQAAEKIRESNEETRVSQENQRVEDHKKHDQQQQANNEAQKTNDTQQAKNNADQAANNQAAMGLIWVELTEDQLGPNRIPNIQGEFGKLYFAPAETPAENDTAVEWMWKPTASGDARWERVGTSEVIPPASITTEQIDQILAGESLSGKSVLGETGLSYYSTGIKNWVATEAKAKTAGTADVAKKLGTETVGSADTAIYILDGVATVVSKVKAASTADSASVAAKIGSQTVGGTDTPVFINEGVPTAITKVKAAANADSAAKLGTGDVGNATTPVYIKGGVATAGNPYPTIPGAATQSAPGLMSADDKKKLDAITGGAATSLVLADGTTIDIDTLFKNQTEKIRTNIGVVSKTANGLAPKIPS